ASVYSKFRHAPDAQAISPPSPPAEKATASQVHFGQKRKSPRPAHQFALPLKADKSPHQAWRECGKRSTLLKKSKREEKKGQSRRELSERLDVGRSEMFGGL